MLHQKYKQGVFTFECQCKLGCLYFLLDYLSKKALKQMSKLLNRLPGFQTSPPGKERWILRQAPFWTLMGTLAILMPSFLTRIISSDPRVAGNSGLIDILVIATLICYWIAIFTIVIGAYIVVLMKGPAYVADAYPLEDSDRPKG